MEVSNTIGQIIPPPGEKSPGNYLIWGWVGFRCGLDMVAKKTYSHRGSNSCRLPLPCYFIELK